MTDSGARARIAWRRESKRVASELRAILASSEISLLAFDEGEQIRRTVLESYALARQAGLLRRLSTKSSQELVSSSRLGIAAFPDGAIILLLQRSERKGVYVVQKRDIEADPVALLAYDGDTVIFATTDCARGVLLDREECEDGAITYEIEMW